MIKRLRNAKKIATTPIVLVSFSRNQMRPIIAHAIGIDKKNEIAVMP